MRICLSCTPNNLSTLQRDPKSKLLCNITIDIFMKFIEKSCETLFAHSTCGPESNASKFPKVSRDYKGIVNTEVASCVINTSVLLVLER